MTATDTKFYETTIHFAGNDYYVAAELTGSKTTSREAYEHFGFRGSYEDADIGVEIDSFSVFPDDNRESEILCSEFKRHIERLLQSEVDDKAQELFNFD